MSVKTRLARAVAAGGTLVLVLAAALLAGAAHAQDAEDGPVRSDTRIHLTYDFHGKGLRLMRLKMAIDLDAAQYEASSEAETKGLIDLFAGARNASRVSGRIRRLGLLPQRFAMVSEKGSDTKRFKLAWARDGAIDARRSYSLDPYKAESIEANVRPGMPDPLTALLQGALFNAERPCSASHRVYNGKQIFGLRYRLLGDDRLGDNHEGAYRGPAHVCEIDYVPVGGYSRSKMKEFARELQRPFRIWMAPVEAETLNGTILIPVKIEARIDGVDTVAYIREGRINGNALNGQSYAKR